MCLCVCVCVCVCMCVIAFRTAADCGGSVAWSPHGAELRRRRTARTERRAREREETQRKKDDEEMMQRTLKELEEHRQVPTVCCVSSLIRGGFRHVQHVPPNRGPHKKGPHKRTGKFLQHGNIAMSDNLNNFVALNSSYSTPSVL